MDSLLPLEGLIIATTSMVGKATGTQQNIQMRECRSSFKREKPDGAVFYN